jgi:hypothetical protein
MCQWDFAVDEPLPTESSRSSLLSSVDIIRERVAAGESLRTLGHAYGVSHESIRRVIRFATSTPVPSAVEDKAAEPPRLA